ncbi:copia protein [Tanacetum coccineum]
MKGSGYQQKDRKPSQNDKTEHGMEKTVQNQGQRQHRTAKDRSKENRDGLRNGKGDRKCFRCGNPNHLIEECSKLPKDKNQRAFVGGFWSDSGEEDDEKVKDETCLVAQASSEKQTALAISTTEAEYISTGKACQQALWMKQALIDYDVRLDDVPIILFKHVMSVFLELAIDHYLSHDRVMHPLAPHYERKTRSDHGKKIPHDSNASSSSTTRNHPSSSRLLDDIVDENDEESFHSNSSSPSQNISSSSLVISRVRQKHSIIESSNIEQPISPKYTLQPQQGVDHWKG